MTLIFLGVLGACLGSFVSALVWRLRHNRDWVKERSECSHCGHHLSAADLIPVVSWIWLRGKCRYCRKPIDDSPTVELGLAGAFVWSYMALGPKSSVEITLFTVWLLLLVVLAALFVYDIKWFELPDKLVVAATVLATVHLIIETIWLRQDAGNIWGALSGAIFLSGLFYALFQLSGGKWIGGGDVKLGVALGLIAGGLMSSFLLLFIASVAGTIISLPLLMAGKASKQTKLPFGPLLIAAAFLVALYGQEILAWYQSQFLYL